MTAVSAQPVERWVERAACYGSPADFHPFGNPKPATRANPRRVARERRRAADALAVCQVCPVAPQCREWARHDPLVGPWAVAGGQVPAERVGAPCWTGTPLRPARQPPTGERRPRSTNGHGEKGWAHGCRCGECESAHRVEVARERAWRQQNPWAKLTPLQRTTLLSSHDGTLTASPRVLNGLARRELICRLGERSFPEPSGLLTLAGTRLVQQHRKDTP